MGKTCHAPRDTYEEAGTAQRLRKAEPAGKLSRTHHYLRVSQSRIAVSGPKSPSGCFSKESRLEYIDHGQFNPKIAQELITRK
jgi:hypothetical protein